jgi:hypothetical protein
MANLWARRLGQRVHSSGNGDAVKQNGDKAKREGIAVIVRC